jgi:hypothetical protein
VDSDSGNGLGRSDSDSEDQSDEDSEDSRDSGSIKTKTMKSSTASPKASSRRGMSPKASFVGGGSKSGPIGPKSIKSMRSNKSGRSAGLASVVSAARQSIASGKPSAPPEPKLSAYQLAQQQREAEAKAKAQADADALAARIEQWRLWMNANSLGGCNAPMPPPANAYIASITPPPDPDPLSRKRTAQLTVQKSFPVPPPTHHDWRPSVPEGLTWLSEEGTWQAAVNARVHGATPIGSAVVNVTCMDSYGVTADLDAVLLHPMLCALGLQRGTSGAGAVDRSFPILPSLPKHREPEAAMDPAPAASKPYTYAELVEVRTSAQKAAEARPHQPPFVEKFYPRMLGHVMTFHPYTPAVQKVANTRPLPVSIQDRMRMRKWLDEGLNSEPPMWYLLKHPHL